MSVPRVKHIVEVLSDHGPEIGLITITRRTVQLDTDVLRNLQEFPLKPTRQHFRLPPAQFAWLSDLVAGYDPRRNFKSRSDYGGATATVAALTRQGWIDSSGQITPAGIERLQRECTEGNQLPAPKRKRKGRHL